MRYFGAEDSFVENSEINVTPFIDVMLVLLIVFMIVAPLSTTNVPVDLPVSSARTPPAPDKPVTVTLKGDLTLYVDDAPSNLDRLGADLRRGGATASGRILVRADKSVPYGAVMRLMDGLRAGGFLKIALVGMSDGAGGA